MILLDNDDIYSFGSDSDYPLKIKKNSIKNHSIELIDYNKNLKELINKKNKKNQIIDSLFT